MKIKFLSRDKTIEDSGNSSVIIYSDLFPGSKIEKRKNPEKSKNNNLFRFYPWVKIENKKV